MYRDYKHLASLFYSGTVFVAFDTETTGVHKEKDYLMEIGAVKFDCKGEISRFDMLIKPPVCVPHFVKTLTHISDEMLEGQPCAFDALLEFIRFLGGKNTILIAHNAPFDIGFINTELRRSNLPLLENTCIDSLPLARWTYPDLNNEKTSGNYKLQALAQRFGVEAVAAHRAGDDARVLMEVFKRIVRDAIPKQKDFNMDECAPEKKDTMQLELF